MRRSGTRYSVRARATLVTVLVSAVLLALALSLTGRVMRDWFRNRSQDQTERTVQELIFDIDRGLRSDPVPVGKGQSDLIQVETLDGRVIAASAKMRGRPALVVPDDTELINTKVCPGYLDRCAWVYGIRMRESAYGRNVMVLAGSPLPVLTSVWALSLLLSLLLAAFLTLIGWWTWRAIGLALEPVDRIQEEMSEIRASNLSRRVPVPQTGGHFRRLADTVNDTLARLEEAATRERRFTSDASHDLRNPIAGLRTRLEVALDDPDDHELRPAMRAALTDVERLGAIVDDLLELARLDSLAPMPIESLDLSRLTRREIERRGPGKPITTRLEPDVRVRASPVRLSRVLHNLLNNADRHARSAIEVTVAREGGQARLEVLDDGSGVPEDERERVFERFSRLPESRGRDPHGTGLGLPIAREIAEVYGGSLTIQDSPSGARFVLTLPLAQDPPAP
ncbi:sensor histidine kinase [Actinomadura syzygii]|uniref:histidine kinase n=1 Tax=Actinomadura syzygii TaxID=1427538 RepID=A0A5D0U5C6_9ACTN|nr:HAMP domain-containing sensor histidine kinase [Actinomadura syzygii]TYC13267.1 HAMP domain-containing histidine kinase [Actinomadura syzygii]